MIIVLKYVLNTFLAPRISPRAFYSFTLTLKQNSTEKSFIVKQSTGSVVCRSRELDTIHRRRHHLHARRRQELLNRQGRVSHRCSSLGAKKKTTNREQKRKRELLLQSPAGNSDGLI